MSSVKKPRQSKKGKSGSKTIADEILAGETRASKTPKRQSRSRAKTSNHRHFFTVEEDWLIIQHLKSNPEEKTSKAATAVAALIDDRSKESIRDRIKRYLKLISAGDQRKIQFAAKRTPGYHVHFIADKSGSGKVIKEIASSDPGLVTGATKASKPARSKSTSRPASKSKLLKKRSPRVRKVVEEPAEPIDLNELVADTRSRSVVRNSGRSYTPEPSYVSKGRKRGASLLIEPSRSKIIDKNPSKPKFDLLESLEARRDQQDMQNQTLNNRLPEFLTRLKLRDPEDIRANAELLTDVIRSFSVSYGLDIKSVTKGIFNKGAIMMTG